MWWNLGLCLALLGVGWAQRNYVYGNEWIEAGRSYKKLLVWRDGIYRIRAADMGVIAPTGTLRLFWRGQEVPIYVVDGGDGIFSGEDYIEFVGHRNDGEPDSVVYRHPYQMRRQPGLHGNPLMPLNQNDTSAYFLTWGGAAGERLISYEDPDVLNHPTQDWFWWRFVESFHERSYWSGGSTYEISNNPLYIAGEGRVAGFNPFDRSYNIPNPRSNVTNEFFVELSHCGINASGTFELEWHINDFLAQRLTLNAPYYFRHRFAVPVSFLRSSIRVRCISTTSGYRGEAVHYGAVIYPRQATLGAADTFLMIGVVNPASTPLTLVLSNVPIQSGDSLLVYDPRHGYRWRATFSGGKWYIPIPAIADTFPLYIVRGQSVRTPLVRTPVLEGLSSFIGAEIILVTHRLLAASAQAYKQYRENHPTNPRSVVIAYTDAIYDEFGWGRVEHPLAIKNLVRWALDHWTVRPKYLLLWGDAVGLMNRLGYGQPPPPYHLVPIFGYPASDWGYVSDFYGEGDLVPEIPVGRVPAQNDNHGYTYIDKLRTYESMGTPQWTKWALHLGGGANAIEQALIGSHLIACQQVFEGSPYEGSVVYYQKRTGGMQAPPGTPTIKERIDSGVVIIQTFGHTGSEIFDVSFYEPQDYDNWGKYPLVIVNGCYQGNFDEVGSISQIHSERFLFEPGRGCLWYLSLAGSGFIGPLGNQSRIMYEVWFRDSLGIPVGDGLVETLRRLIAQGIGPFEYYHFAAQSLLGDPCVRLALPLRPDLAISTADIHISPSEPSAEASRFYLFIRYRNLGTSFSDSFTVRVRHRISSTGQFFAYTYRRAAFTRTDSFEVSLAVSPGEWAGGNEIEVFIDSDDEIGELREDNNQARIEFFVRSPRPIPLYPWPFAVINKDSISLIAATYSQGIFAPQGYYFEIDTSYRFDSPMLRQSGLVRGTTTFAQWSVPFLLRDSMVYYWRVRLEGSGPQEWATQSFQYIRGPKEGWGQSARPQFIENALVGLQYSIPSFRWAFTQRSVKIEVRDTYSPLGARRFLEKDGEMLSYSRSHTLVHGWWNGARTGGVFIAVFDPVTFEPLESSDIFGKWLYFCSGFCYQRSSPAPYQVQMTADALADSLWAVIQRAPQGSPIILLFTSGHTPETWSPRMSHVLAAIGGSNAPFNLTPRTKGIVFGIKGAPPATAMETFCADTASCSLQREFIVTLPIGWMYSPRIPRPVQWEEAFFAYDKQSLRDTITISIYGIRADGSQDTLYGEVPHTGIYDLLPYNNRDYTELRLSAHFGNTTTDATPQLRYWYVLFQPFADIAIDPGVRWVLRRDTVEEGESLYVEIGLRNLLSAETADSVEVLYLIQKASGEWDTLAWQRYRPLAGLDTLIARLSFSSIGLGGANRLRIIANPRPLFGERTFANNRWEASFYVSTDHINPVVDVLFDGYRIQNGDLVSPEPIITIEVKDENRFLALDDTSTVIVRLRRAEERGLGERITYSSGKLSFTPASLPDNRARVEFRPDRLANGEYILSVEAFDKKRNRSGAAPYEVRFRVINESSITYLINYPNPFSTSTRFFYELTGAVLPEVFQIHIYTITGRLVKVIDLKALGEVRIGRHLTTYAWDGTDEHGDRLANGVYLYRVILRMPEGQNIERREEGLSDFFKGGWGKMVLMR